MCNINFSTNIFSIFCFIKIEIQIITFASKLFYLYDTYTRERERERERESICIRNLSIAGCNLMYLHLIDGCSDVNFR